MARNENRRNSVLKKLKRIEGEVSKRRSKDLNLILAGKMAQRLGTFAHECQECGDLLEVLDEDLSELLKTVKLRKRTGLRDYKKYFDDSRKISSHLRKAHNLVPPRYYTKSYLSLGIGIGLPLGAAIAGILGNTALLGAGLPIGIGIGVSVGSSLDSKARKNGLVI